jgi:formylglycine-generating enzyme required for sulfatase activity
MAAGVITHLAFAVTPSPSYSSSQNYLTDVGAYGADSASFYGANDMGGNLTEWNDAVDSNMWRGVRGGDWGGGSNGSLETQLRSSSRFFEASNNDATNSYGFRIAGVPEPGTLVLSMLFSMGLFLRRKR